MEELSEKLGAFFPIVQNPLFRERSKNRDFWQKSLPGNVPEMVPFPDRTFGGFGNYPLVSRDKSAGVLVIRFLDLEGGHEKPKFWCRRTPNFVKSPEIRIFGPLLSVVDFTSLSPPIAAGPPFWKMSIFDKNHRFP